jgi:hypothetical protein
VRVLSGRAAVERSTSPLEMHARPDEPVGEDIVGERHDLVTARMNIAMHVAYEMTDTGRLCEVARRHDEDVLVRGADNVGCFRVVVEKLARVKNGAGRQFEREHDPIWRFDESSYATTIDGAH